MRYEALEGQVRPRFNASDDLLSLKSTLFLEHRRGPLRLGAEVNDSRAWGANRRTPIGTGDVNTFELTQIYAAIDVEDSAAGPVRLKAGRFLLNLGSRRLVAASDERNTTNSYAGLRAEFAPYGVTTTLVYVRPRLRLPDDLDSLLDNRHRPDRDSRALELWGGTAIRQDTLFGAALEGSYFRLRERDAPGRPTRDRDLETLGVRILRAPTPGRWDYEVEVVGQRGEISQGVAPNDPRLPVRAGFLHAEAGHTAPSAWRPRISAEFDLATGDKPGGVYGRFDTLFGSRRADLAPAGLYSAIGRSNIVSPGLRLEITPSPRWDGFVGARALWLQARQDAFSTTGVSDPAGASGRFAGLQADGRIRRWLIPDRLRAEINGVWLNKGHFLRRAPNAPRSGDERSISTTVTTLF